MFTAMPPSRGILKAHLQCCTCNSTQLHFKDFKIIDFLKFRTISCRLNENRLWKVPAQVQSSGFQALRNMLVIKYLVYQSITWLQTLASCQHRHWEAPVTAQGPGFSPSMWETWNKFLAPKVTHCTAALAHSLSLFSQTHV